MTDQHPFEQLFDQIADLLALTKANEQKVLSGEPLDETIDQQIDELEQQISLFQKATDEALRLSAIDVGEIENMINDPSDELGQRQKKILLKTGRLKSELESIQREYARSLKLVMLQKKKAKTQGKKRIKKFKRLGGQGWLPM